MWSVWAAPRIECEHPRYDFGTCLVGEPITNRFVLRNCGDEPLEILNIKNCCGVTSELDSTLIAPGTNAVCTSIFTTKNRAGVQEKQILLVTNDKRTPYYDLRMTGTLKKPIEFFPRFIRLKDVLPDQDFSATIIATNLLEQAVELERVDVSVDGLDAKIVGSDERSWTIQLTSNAPLSVGKVNGRAQLYFSTGVVDVPIAGVVEPILKATPDQIAFSSNSTGTINRIVMVRSADGRPFDIGSVELRGAEGEVRFKKLAEGKWQINAELHPASIKPAASMVIETSVESLQTMHIPLSVR